MVEIPAAFIKYEQFVVIHSRQVSPCQKHKRPGRLPAVGFESMDYVTANYTFQLKPSNVFEIFKWLE